MKYRFKVLDGKHKEGDVRFAAGEVFESDERMDLRFKNKFEILNAPAPQAQKVPGTAGTGKAPAPQKPVPPAPASVVGTGLKAIHRGRGRWDVIEVSTGEAVNDDFLNKKDAEAMAATGR